MPRKNRRRKSTRSHAGRQQMLAVVPISLVPVSNSRCKANTQSGHRCKNPATKKGYCGVHETSQCSGMTKSGSRCKNPAHYHGHCATHYRQNPAAIKKFGIAMGRAAKKTGEGIVKGAKYAGRKSYKAGAIGKAKASVGLANQRVKSLQKCAKELDVGKSQLEATKEMKKARRAVADAEAKLAQTRKDVAHLNPRRRSNSSYNFVSTHSNAAQRKKHVASMKRKVSSIHKKIMNMGDYEKIRDEIDRLDFFAYDRYIDDKEVMKAKRELKKLNEALKKARFEAGQMRLMDSINEKRKAAHRGRGEYKPRRYLNSRRRSNSNWTALYFGVSDMQVGGKYKATFGGSTWYFEPTHPMSKSGKIKGLLLSDSDRTPTIKFIGKKTSYDGLDWAEGSQFPQSVESKFNKKRNPRRGRGTSNPRKRNSETVILYMLDRFGDLYQEEFSPDATVIRMVRRQPVEITAREAKKLAKSKGEIFYESTAALRSSLRADKKEDEEWFDTRWYHNPLKGRGISNPRRRRR